MQLRSFILFLFMVISMTACGPDYLFQQRIEIPNQEWTYEQIADFEIEVKDTLELYNLILEIEHSVNYSKQNIYVKIHTEFPSGEKLSKQIPINFADKGGQWYGDCGNEVRGSCASCSQETVADVSAFDGETRRAVD